MPLGFPRVERTAKGVMFFLGGQFLSLVPRLLAGHSYGCQRLGR